MSSLQKLYKGFKLLATQLIKIELGDKIDPLTADMLVAMNKHFNYIYTELRSICQSIHKSTETKLTKLPPKHLQTQETRESTSPQLGF